MSIDVACGVTSRGPRPVPPVVTTRSAPATTAATMASVMRSFLSGTTSGSETSKSAFCRRLRSAGPLRSSRVPAETPSLTVITCARWVTLGASRSPRDLQRIALRGPLADCRHGLRRHAHDALRGRLARSRELVRDVDHARRALVIQVSQPLGHGHQDMTMADIEGVLFDYGRTLVTFAYPTDDLLRVLGEFRPRIETALGVQ